MSMDIHYSKNARTALTAASRLAERGHAEFVTPEHLVKALLDQDEFCALFGRARRDPKGPAIELDAFIAANSGLAGEGETPEPSVQMKSVVEMAAQAVQASGREEVDVPHLVYGVLNQEDSYAREWLTGSLGLMEADILSEVFAIYSASAGASREPKDETWKQFCTALDPSADGAVIGRTAEVERAVMVMCRKEKNNPVLVGDHGVGKSAVVRAIAARIASGDVPERLQGKTVWCLDIPSVLAGAQFRGEMEDRLRRTMEGLRQTGNAVVFIDNIHDIAGAGRNGDSSIDASSVLLPYMREGDLAFIGTTTFDDYKKSIQRSRPLERMFQRIDIEEPSEAETVEILEGLKDRYGEYHSVIFGKGAMEHAVERSMRYMPSQRLPEKAIDLIDEAGAWCETHPESKGRIDRELIDRTVERLCGVSVADGGSDGLEDLKGRLEGRIFGQQGAVDSVCEAVYMSKAGLSDPVKPMASLLFVGPTGVGKTQLAKELAEGLGVPLQRFDMSEYTEKHTVSKFIGAPAGYVGYDEGGLLTDTVRKTPRCVLLLDEIEKAHQDIYNLLLQVMDYGTLTDAKGQKADFRNVVLIMTSNAGARFASRPAIGYNGVADAGAAMGKEVKNVFAPEFINRLTGTVVFNSLSREMASLIADAKLRDLGQLLASKGIALEVTPAAKDLLLDLGYSPEYGAREIERTVTGRVKPLLVREMLFGALKNGGKAVLDADGKEFSMKVNG